MENQDWRERFDEKWEAVYCVECLKGTWKREHVKAFIESELQAERERVKKALLDKLHATYGVDGGAALVIVENDEMGGVSQRHGLSEVKRIIEAL